MSAGNSLLQSYFVISYSALSNSNWDLIHWSLAPGSRLLMDAGCITIVMAAYIYVKECPSNIHCSFALSCIIAIIVTDNVCRDAAWAVGCITRLYDTTVHDKVAIWYHITWWCSWQPIMIDHQELNSSDSGQWSSDWWDPIHSVDLFTTININLFSNRVSAALLCKVPHSLHPILVVFLLLRPKLKVTSVLV